ncbi:MAG: DMT family transporter [Anaerolineae bacterium]
MNGILISILSGVGFGLFQTLNRRAGQRANVYQATFVLLLVSSAVLILVSAVFEDLSLLVGVSPWAILHFSLAAFIHFFVGWTLFSLSQKKVGAARTSVLLGTVPLWATLIGVLFFDEFLSGAAIAGILIIMVGTYVISTDKIKDDNSAIESGIKASLYGLGTAVCFAGSSIFIRYGLELLPSPLLGVTIGMTVVTAIYAVFYWSQSGTATSGDSRLTGSKLGLQIFAGILVAIATWWRWIALDLTPIAIVISLSRLSIPTVLLLSPFLIGQKLEQVNARVWLGAAVLISGALILTFG